MLSNGNSVAVMAVVLSAAFAPTACGQAAEAQAVSFRLLPRVGICGERKILRSDESRPAYRRMETKVRRSVRAILLDRLGEQRLRFS